MKVECRFVNPSYYEYWSECEVVAEADGGVFVLKPDYSPDRYRLNDKYVFVKNEDIRIPLQ